MVSRCAVFAVSTDVIMATGATLAKLTEWDLKYRMPEPRAMPPVRPSIASVTTEVFFALLPAESKNVPHGRYLRVR